MSNSTSQSGGVERPKGTTGEEAGNSQAKTAETATSHSAQPKLDIPPIQQNQAAGIAVIARLTSTSSSADQIGAISAFKACLFNIIDLPQPDSSDKPLSFLRLILMRFLTFGENDQQLGYSQLVARYISLWSVFERPDTHRFAMQAFPGMQLLTKGRFRASSKILHEIEFQTSTAVALSYVMKGVGLFVRSLVFFSFFAGYTVILFHSSVFGSHAILSTEDTAILWRVLVATIAGMMGSVVSILLRLGEFEATKGRSRMFLMLTGATLPVVGGMFGAFVAALLSANIINIASSGSNGLNVWLFLVIGFLSGFSERFSRGFIRIAEDRLGPGGQIDQKVNLTAQAIVPTLKTAGGDVAVMQNVS